MTRSIINPHDRYFKSAMKHKEVAKEFFEAHLPQHIRQYIDLTTLESCKADFIDEELRASLVDVLFKVQVNQQPGYIYLLSEHQSRGDYWMPFRLLKYVVRILDEHVQSTGDTKLPVVIPLLYYNGQPSPYPYSTDLLTLFNDPLHLMKEVLFKPFHLIDLGQIPDETDRQKIWLSMLQLTMKRVWERDFLQYLPLLLELIQHIDQQRGEDYITSTLKYVIEAAEISDPKLFATTIRESLSQPLGENLMGTMAQYFEKQGIQKGFNDGLMQGIEQGIERGIERGIEKGKQEGLQEGESLLLQKLLEHKFGFLPEKYHKRLKTADAVTLLTWGKRVLNATNLEDVFEIH